MKVYFVRHGETSWNAIRHVCGRTDLPLNEKGIQQAREVAEYIRRNKEALAIEYMFVSPMMRARQTAAFTEEVLGLTAEVDQRLIEVNFGSMEGRDWDDVEFLKIKNCPFSCYPDGGESILQAAHRGYSFLDGLKERCHDRNAVIFCHGSIARIMGTYFQSYTSEEYAAIRIQNCEVREYEL